MLIHNRQLCLKRMLNTDPPPLCVLLAAVGDNMSDTPGVSGRFFGALAKAKVNVLAISQGSSERNISAVVNTANAQLALRSIHSAFLSGSALLSLGVLVKPNEATTAALAPLLADTVCIRLQIPLICMCFMWSMFSFVSLNFVLHTDREDRSQVRRACGPARC